MKKYYESVGYKKTLSGFQLYTDKNLLQTPLGKSFTVPSEALAVAISDEWKAQRKVINKETMPLTQIACVCIDLVTEKRSEVCEELLAYAETDLVCYRAGTIPVLYERQKKLLSPLLAWAERCFLVELHVTEGLMPIKQPSGNILKLRTALSEYEDWVLAVIATTTKLMSSIILALAFAEGELTAEDAFMLSQLEETYETEQWGEDEEKQIKQQKIRDELKAAEWFLSLL